MDNQQRFAIGDRVRTIRATATVPHNAVGTVRIVFYIAELYSVCFDGLPGFHIIHHSELTREPLNQRSPTA